MAKTNKKPAAKAASVNPMKDGPEENDGKVKFETEELATYAAEAAEEYGLELGEMVGTGPDAVITADDVDAAVTAADNMEDPDAVNFASEDAGEFYAENEEKIDLDEVEGTGKEGAITVDDLKAVIPAEPAAEAKFTTDTVKEAADAAVKDHGVDLATVTGTAKDGSINAADVRKAVEAIEAANAPEPSDDEAEEEVDEIKSIIDDIVSFGLPVRGALKNKPLVLARWLDLQYRAVKTQRSF